MFKIGDLVYCKDADVILAGEISDIKKRGPDILLYYCRSISLVWEKTPDPVDFYLNYPFFEREIDIAIRQLEIYV